MFIQRCIDTILTWQATKNNLDTLSRVRLVLKLRHIWQATYSPMYLRSSDSMYCYRYLHNPRVSGGGAQYNTSDTHITSSKQYQLNTPM